jgi:hypothetical protein
MRNPLRSEAEAFRFLIGAIVYFGVIAIAAGFGGRWWGVGAFVVASAVAGWVFLRREPVEQPVRVVTTQSPRERRILLLAPPGSGGSVLRNELRSRGAGGEVVVVVPALATPLEQVTGAVDDRRDDAQRQADALAAELGGDGLRVRAEVGADDPLQAIEDTLRLFGADEIVIAGGDEDLLTQARERFALPVSPAEPAGSAGS